MAQHILYIDDVPDHLVLIQRFIETHLPGVVVDTCETIAGAESALSQRCYDLIISDINLRGELGTRIAKQVLDFDPSQPIMLVSEYVGENVAREVGRLSEQGVPCWPKFTTVDFGSLITTVKELLQRRPCPRLTADEDHPDFCRFKSCMREDHGGEDDKSSYQQSYRSPRLVLIRPLSSAAA